MSDTTGLSPAGKVLPATPVNLARIDKRWEGLNERVEAKVRTLKDRDRTPELRMVSQAENASTASQRVTWLRKAADYLHDGAKHLAACGKGCSHCCHISVMVSRAEAQVIARETGAKLNRKAGRFTMETVDMPSALEAATAESFGKPCTFLKDGDCTVYDHRPLACRLLLNLDDDPLLCQLVEGAEPKVPYLNATEHHIGAAVAFGPHQEYDDLRHWFPAGLGSAQLLPNG